jgi:hypothetical protein
VIIPQRQLRPDVLSESHTFRALSPISAIQDRSHGLWRPRNSAVRSFCQYRIRAGDRGPQTKEGTGLVVVLEPLGDDPLETATVEDQDPV